MPLITKEHEWRLPADNDDVIHAVVSVLSMYQPDASENHIGMLTQILRQKRYSRAELVYATWRLIDDPELDNKLRFKQPVTAADYRRVIDDVRRTRRLLRTPLPRRDVLTLIKAHPELKQQDFTICGADEFDSPLYMYRVENGFQVYNAGTHDEPRWIFNDSPTMPDEQS